MSIYGPVIEMLDEVIESYREEFKQANETVTLNGFLDNYDMNHLLKSNSKVQAALRIRAIVISVEEKDKSNICRLVESWMNEAIRAGNYSVARLYENVLKIMNQSGPDTDSCITRF